MDAELKALLSQLLTRLDDFDKRLKAVESKAHDQITLDDYWKRFHQTPTPGAFPWPPLKDLTPIRRDHLWTISIC